MESNEKYKNFKFNVDNQKWYSFYECHLCKNKILVEASKEYYLARNLKKKGICKKCSLKKQKGVGNPFYNKTHTEESKNKISKSKIGISTSNHMSKPKYRKMFSDMKKKLWASGEMEGIRIKMSKLMKERIMNGELKSYNRSKAEDEIINKLSEVGINCEPNYRIGSKIFDIYIPQFNLLIEYNGDYWHCNPKKYNAEYWHKKKSKTAKEIWLYDNKKLYLAKKNGYNSKVIWERDYKRNPELINEIIKYYENKQN